MRLFGGFKTFKYIHIEKIQYKMKENKRYNNEENVLEVHIMIGYTFL
tara:strand:- start:400 stop:540 length:141 start_codon:yes stop_codon:yes gene_type:complete